MECRSGEAWRTYLLQIAPRRVLRITSFELVADLTLTRKTTGTAMHQSMRHTFWTSYLPDESMSIRTKSKGQLLASFCSTIHLKLVRWSSSLPYSSVFSNSSLSRRLEPLLARVWSSVQAKSFPKDSPTKAQHLLTRIFLFALLSSRPTFPDSRRSSTMSQPLVVPTTATTFPRRRCDIVTVYLKVRLTSDTVRLRSS